MTQIEDHARSIFLAALERAPEQCPAFLDEACAGNAELRARVDQLLHAHQAMGSIHGGRADAPALPPVATIDEPAVTERPGTVIGPYKLLEQIGEGGFGVVFMAEQQQPVRRKVALKVLKPGMDTKQVIARFEAERQALAIMDHPNIAKVFDGGMTGEPGCVSAGRPYFVMELVKGVPITEFCDQNHLTPRQRLELFVPVCQAVQHAHQKGIIHRDLKPSNVLVSRHDTTPIVKVIDFGVAKALGQELTDKTLFTGIAQMIGTPLYMSPEQAGMSDLDIDTRSDIYSLGVMLYELLTGTTPFDKDRFKKAAYDEIRRIIREEEPPKPSTRLSELGRSREPSRTSGAPGPARLAGPTSSLASVSALRHTEPTKLTKLVRGELDWIVMKALEKDRNRRYETASAFAADVQRYLHDEAVQACPPSTLYRLRKFARRHGPALATVSLLSVVLVAGVVISTWQAIKASQAKSRALREAAKARAINDFLIKDLLAQGSTDNNPVGAKITIRELLDRASTKIDHNKAFAEEPEVEAAIRLTIGNAYNDVCLFEQAGQHLLRALDIRRNVLGAEHPDTVTAMGILAQVLMNQGRMAESEDYYRQILAAMRRISAEDYPELLIYQTDMGQFLENEGRFAEAESLLRQCLETQRRVLTEEHPTTLKTLTHLGFTLGAQGRFAEAEPLLRRCWETKQRVQGKDHLETLQGAHLLAELLYAEGKWVESAQRFGQLVDDSRRAAGPEHIVTLQAMIDLCGVLISRGEVRDAEPLVQQALEIGRRVYGPDNIWLLGARRNLARLLLARGQLDEAERLFREDVAAPRHSSDHLGTLNAPTWLARGLEARGKWDDAERLFREVSQDLRRVRGPEHFDTLTVTSDLAVLLHTRGKSKEAEPLFREALRGQRKVLPSEHPNLALTLFGWGNYLLDKGDAAEAEPALREALQIERKTLVREHTATGQTLAALGWALTKQGRAADGEPLLRDGLVICRKALPEGHWAMAHAENLLGGCLTAQRKYKEAEPVLLSAYKALQAAPGGFYNKDNLT
jgi:serine/threonine protein kinase